MNTLAVIETAGACGLACGSLSGLNLSCVDVPLLRETEVDHFGMFCSTPSRTTYLQRQIRSKLPIQTSVQTPCLSHRIAQSVQTFCRITHFAQIGKLFTVSATTNALFGSPYDGPGSVIISGFRRFVHSVLVTFHLFFAPALGLTSSGAMGCNMTLLGVCVVLFV